MTAAGRGREGRPALVHATYRFGPGRSRRQARAWMDVGPSIALAMGGATSRGTDYVLAWSSAL